MIPARTAEIFQATALTGIYSVTVVAFGATALKFIAGEPSAAISTRLGLAASVWIGFIVGQGIVSTIWLALALAGSFAGWLVSTLSALGCLIAALWLIEEKRHIVRSLQLTWQSFRAFLGNKSWYSFLVSALLLVTATAAIRSLLPTGIDDALRWYMVLPSVLAARHKLELLPFLMPYYGLQPLQIEMHWAALFAVSSESAIALWDYLSAVSSLIGVALLANILTKDYRVSIVAVVIMLTTSGFYYLIGGGKPDNAAAQYGIAAFMLIALRRRVNRRFIAIAGLCLGWSLASRYTNMFLIPGLLLFALLRSCDESGGVQKRLWMMDTVVLASAAALAIAPMLFKNWLLLGCPLAPAYGCQNTVWSGIEWAKGATWVHNQKGLWLGDLFSYPFVWTFADRPEMLGNISPLFLGLIPIAIVYRRSAIVRAAGIAGAAGLIAIFTWWLFINALFPYARWVLLPLALLSIYLGAAAVASDQHADRLTRLLMRAAVVMLFALLMFQSRSVVYAVRYAAGIDSRDAAYKTKPGYDVAVWLNQNIPSTERVAFAGWNGYSYFVRTDHLVNSESAVEFQKLWEFCRCRAPIRWTADFWKFYAEAGFNYTIVARHRVPAALAVLPHNMTVEIAFAGRDETVLRIASYNPGASG